MSFFEMRDARVYYRTGRGINRAIDGVSFHLDEGRSIGLVGESGCGKSTLARAIIRVMAKNAYVAGGEILLDGEDLLRLSDEKMRRIRWKKIAMVSQAAMDSLNPVYRSLDPFTEILTLKGRMGRMEARERARELFEMVALDTHYLQRYPHEFSGGMKQRVAIALAFSLNPKLLIADEPVTALDVIVQNQILGELKALKARFNVALIMITHDISVVAQTCDHIAVMYAGKIVELGTATAVIKNPAHPYTMGLENAFPNLREPKDILISIEGSPPDLVNPVKGCRFEDRCPFNVKICSEEEPPLIEVYPGHFSACHRLAEIEILRSQTKEADTWVATIS